MASIGEDLRDYLLSLPELTALVDERIHQDHVPQTPLDPDGYFERYIWFESVAIGREECTNQSQGSPPEWWEINLECIAYTGQEADAMVEVIRGLDGYKGTLGARTVQGLFVDDQTDDYLPRGLRTDVGASVKAVALEIHRSPTNG